MKSHWQLFEGKKYGELDWSDWDEVWQWNAEYSDFNVDFYVLGNMCVQVGWYTYGASSNNHSLDEKIARVCNTVEGRPLKDALALFETICAIEGWK